MEQITFGIFTDLHGEIMPDSKKRLQVFMDDAKSRTLDFIIQAGDFAPLGSHDAKMVHIYNAFQGEKYHVLGNHDTDDCVKEDAIHRLQIPHPYYRFKSKGFKCIVLDTNNFYCEDTDTYVPFDKNSLDMKRSRSCIPPEQLQWLEQELQEDCKCLIFSHASLTGERTGIAGQESFWKVIDEVHKQAGYKKVKACFHGHDHFDSLHVHHGVYSIGIPSISNQWIGQQHVNTDVQKECLTRYPELIHVVPYAQPLYTFVTCNHQEIIIEGKETTYVGGKPSKYGRDMQMGYDHMSSFMKRKVLPY
ncbi:metallophosphoesterase [Vallitalea pronyensis]|uniref:Metallophosphoesterase n=1 Tax=Vallitalea pronyensis TaxID=1348613 RepID=A0A8J8MNY9_9FIRM|nr:metallophosphoesterase [Vallitalea pronyensis]QUI24698.1 metallophosphoesterase [Vallitalea pronyensis]